MNEYLVNRESVIQERVNLLKQMGYRGFHLNKSHQIGLERFAVEASNVNKVQLEADGNTIDEAFENLIEKIDYTLDDL